MKKNVLRFLAIFAIGVFVWSCAPIGGQNQPWHHDKPKRLKGK